MSRIYVASSWRNEYQPDVIRLLQYEGHEVYDFRNPPGRTGFKWSDMAEGWQRWSMEQYRANLQTSPISALGYTADRRAMQWADTCLLVLPCGRSAHLEAGYFHGANKRLVIYIPEPIEPDLMYLMADAICLSMNEVLKAVK